MKNLTISRRQFEKMDKYVLDSSIRSVEAQLFVWNTKESWNHQKKLLKKYYVTNQEYFSNKLYTINMLVSNRKTLQIPELILPEQLLTIDDEIVGYVMPFIENNINLGTLLNSDGLTLFKKIQTLKEIGKILKKTLYMQNLNINFFLGDIHENNFIFDRDKKIFKAVDLDSCRIGRNNSSVSRYLTFNDKLWNYPQKYPLNEEDIHISNENTVILSYIYMILNTISQTNISKISIEQYYDYLQFLEDLGFNRELINQFSLIYTDGKNKIDLDLLDSIPTHKNKSLAFDNFEKRV